MLQDTDPAAAASLTYKQVEQRKKRAAMAAAEVQYEALQALLMEQLGIKEGDIVEAPDVPAPPAAGAGAGLAFLRGGAPGKAGAAPAAAKKAPPAAAAPAAKGRK